MRRSKGIVLVLLTVVLFMPPACGKKAPPFLAEKTLPFRVEQLKVECNNKTFFLKGTVSDPQGRLKDPSVITGCRVYHAYYGLENPPCEDCPIDYRLFKDIMGKVISDKGFFCQVPVKKTSGIHFFKVQLIGRKGEYGPSSEGAKLITGD